MSHARRSAPPLLAAVMTCALSLSSAPALADGEVGWAASKRTSFMYGRLHLGWEAGYGILAGALPEEGRALVGHSLQVGVRYLPGVEDDTTFEGAYVDTVFGESFGLDARVHLLLAADSPVGAPTLWLFGLTPCAYNYVGSETRTSRVRAPTVLGLILPEVGLAVRSGGPRSLYLAWSAPFAFLLHDAIALEARPTLVILYSTPHEEPDVVPWMSVSALFR